MTEESCGARALYRILDVLGTGAALCAVPLWKLGYQFLKFGLRPGSDRARTHVSKRTERQRELGDVVPVRSVDNDQKIVVARGHIDLLDFDSHFLGQIASGLGALGSILDRADSLVRPVQRADEHGHAVLRAVNRKDQRPRRSGGRPVECERVRRRKKRAISREIVPADGISAASNKRLRHGPVGSSWIRLLRRRCVRKGRVPARLPAASDSNYDARGSTAGASSRKNILARENDMSGDV